MNDKGVLPVTFGWRDGVEDLVHHAEAVERLARLFVSRADAPRRTIKAVRAPLNAFIVYLGEKNRPRQGAVR